MTVDQMPPAKAKSANQRNRETRDEAGAFGEMPKNVTSSTWPVLVFTLIALGAGLAAMAALSGAVVAGTITALITAVLGVVGTHAGHVAGQKLAIKQPATHPLAAGLDQLSQLKKEGKLPTTNSRRPRGNFAIDSATTVTSSRSRCGAEGGAPDGTLRSWSPQAVGKGRSAT